jgi:hypothetical protein
MAPLCVVKLHIMCEICHENNILDPLYLLVCIKVLGGVLTSSIKGGRVSFLLATRYSSIAVHVCIFSRYSFVAVHVCILDVEEWG